MLLCILLSTVVAGAAGAAGAAVAAAVAAKQLVLWPRITGVHYGDKATAAATTHHPPTHTVVDSYKCPSARVPSERATGFYSDDASDGPRTRVCSCNYR